MKKGRYGSRYCKCGRYICAISAVLLYPPPYLPFYNIYHNICYHIHHNIYLTPDHMGTYTLSTTISTTASRAYNIHHNIYLMLQYPPPYLLQKIYCTMSTSISLIPIVNLHYPPQYLLLSRHYLNLPTISTTLSTVTLTGAESM